MRDKPQTHILAICGPAPRFPQRQAAARGGDVGPSRMRPFEWAGLGSVPSF